MATGCCLRATANRGGHASTSGSCLAAPSDWLAYTHRQIPHPQSKGVVLRVAATAHGLQIPGHQTLAVLASEPASSSAAQSSLQAVHSRSIGSRTASSGIAQHRPNSHLPLLHPSDPLKNTANADAANTDAANAATQATGAVMPKWHHLLHYPTSDDSSIMQLIQILGISQEDAEILALTCPDLLRLPQSKLQNNWSTLRRLLPATSAQLSHAMLLHPDLLLQPKTVINKRLQDMAATLQLPCKYLLGNQDTELRYQLVTCDPVHVIHKLRLLVNKLGVAASDARAMVLAAPRLLATADKQLIDSLQALLEVMPHHDGVDGCQFVMRMFHYFVAVRLCQQQMSSCP